ncbi:MAG: tyrosine-protein phosphatase [Solobacterium sp.]|nr:tyrosine-protein phosphatase [Solobacterium sp.]
METIQLEGARNVRDLGNTKNRYGEVIRTGILLRADALHSLTPEDIRRLQDDYHLRTIIDMRTSREIAEKPDRIIEGTEYRNIRIFEEARTGVTREHRASGPERFRHMPPMTDIYREIVTGDYTVQQMRLVLQCAMQENSGTVIFHCTAGKDRTGLAAMFLLTLLDVDYDTIKEDYMMTNTTAIEDAGKFADAVYEQLHDQQIADHIRTAFIAKEEYLDTALRCIEDQCGTLDRYIEERLGISAEEKEAFRRRMLIRP